MRKELNFAVKSKRKQNVLHMKSKLSGIQNLSAALLTIHTAYMKTITVTRIKLFLAAKATESRANMRVNEIDYSFIRGTVQ